MEKRTNEIGNLVEYDPNTGPPLMLDGLQDMRKNLRDVYGFSPEQTISEEIPFEDEMKEELDMFFDNKRYE